MKKALLLFLLVLPIAVPASAAPIKPLPMASLSEAKEIDPVVFEAALNKLKDLGIIADTQYWIDNVRPGKFVEAQPVREMVIAAASKFEPVNDVPAAMQVLQKQKVLYAADKWSTDLVEKNKLAGGLVVIIINRFADKIN